MTGRPADINRGNTMKSIRRKAATAGALAVLALGGTLAATTPASAATAGAYNGACGTGYEVFMSTPIMSSQRTVAATTYVAYSSADKQWCAVTVRNKPGARVFMEVTLDTWPSGNHPARDAGSYTTYAGPVYKGLPEPGQCMTWSGSIDIYYNSDQGLCP
ncbi:hypothetical protein ACIGDI_33395 [Streptomyces sp. NPDC085900]|uniref:hypothetical protein n=1 Tax=Streptomyces sp. NPDC085900 TaxID=3365737 RepID=UPI0037CD1A22